MEERIRYGAGLVQALAALRRRRGLSQTELALRLGVAASHISRFERGGDPRLSTVLDIARALGAEPVLVPKEQLSAVRAVLAVRDSERGGDGAPERPRFA